MTKIEVSEYVRGTNELLDSVLEDEDVWIVQGPNGRLPIIAGTAEEALASYKSKESKWKKKDDEED